MKYVIIALFLVGCSSEVDSSEDTISLPETDTNPVQPYAPKVEPVTYRECVVTKTTNVVDCILYDLMCDDGYPELVLRCPARYWERGEYIPTPP